MLQSALAVVDWLLLRVLPDSKIGPSPSEPTQPIVLSGRSRTEEFSLLVLLTSGDPSPATLQYHVRIRPLPAPAL